MTIREQSIQKMPTKTKKIIILISIFLGLSTLTNAKEVNQPAVKIVQQSQQDFSKMTQKKVQKSLDQIKTLVRENYVEKWYTPSQNYIIKQINKVFKDKTIEQYSEEKIRDFPDKVLGIKEVLSKPCFPEFDKIQKDLEETLVNYLKVKKSKNLKG